MSIINSGMHSKVKQDLDCCKVRFTEGRNSAAFFGDSRERREVGRVPLRQLHRRNTQFETKHSLGINPKIPTTILGIRLVIPKENFGYELGICPVSPLDFG